ncbi:hypothetical protein PAL_GLEAN10002190 [Pteropus alecto]|uniref:Uncharacterized protein n=1 Tax=Pteropus alecto TaxID=9402 RepID=L5K773_PTEAL|nr:hypothetical protein PAL_GLEAN10002190 [Pteropus alecto]
MTVPGFSIGPRALQKFCICCEEAQAPRHYADAHGGIPHGLRHPDARRCGLAKGFMSSEMDAGLRHRRDAWSAFGDLTARETISEQLSLRPRRLGQAERGFQKRRCYSSKRIRERAERRDAGFT